MSHFELIGNGCCEMWPIDTNYKYPYRYCTDDKTTPKGMPRGERGRGGRERGREGERGEIGEGRGK